MILDQSALERYRLKLCYKVSYHLGRSCAEVEDVVQETMIRFVGALRAEKIRNPESVAAFLSGICNNVLLEYKRCLSRRPVTQAGPVSLDPPMASGPDLVELRQIIGMVMSQLAPKEREILRAFYLEQRERPQICQALGISEAQFRVALFRAREKFREIYQFSLKRNAAKQH